MWEAADVLIKAALPLTTSDTKTVSEWISQMATLPQASNLATRILLLTLLFEVRFRPLVPVIHSSKNHQTPSIWDTVEGIEKCRTCLHFMSLQFLIGYNARVRVCCHSCPTLCNPMNCSPWGSSVREILQARTLEWVAMPSSQESSDPGIKLVSLMFLALEGRFFTTSTIWEAQ